MTANCSKFSYFLLALFLPLAAFCQRQANVVHLKTSPVVNGYTLVDVQSTTNKRVVELPDPTVNIYSEKPDVFSITNGIVAATFSVSETYVVMIKKDDSFFVYQNLGTALVKKGDQVTKGTKIGLLSNGPEDLVYKLGFQMWTRSDNTSTKIEPENIIDYLATTDSRK